MMVNVSGTSVEAMRDERMRIRISIFPAIEVWLGRLEHKVISRRCDLIR